jgi:hypothetical protein
MPVSAASRAEWAEQPLYVLEAALQAERDAYLRHMRSASRTSAPATRAIYVNAAGVADEQQQAISEEIERRRALASVRAEEAVPVAAPVVEALPIVEKPKRVRKKAASAPEPEPAPVDSPLALPRLWRRYFSQIGVELEGGWNERISTIVQERQAQLQPARRDPYTLQMRGGLPAEEQARLVPLRMGSDGSVSITAPLVGELSVGPHRDLDQFRTCLQQVWPTAVNASCGLHVHLSLKRDYHYLRLLQPEVTTRLTNRLGEWARRQGLPGGHPMWSRLTGENQYCKAEYHGEEQLTATQRISNRYTIINYCKSLHGTVEVRVLPALATADLGWSALTEVILILGSFLHENRGQERKDRMAEVVSVDEVSESALLEEVRVGPWAFAL